MGPDEHERFRLRDLDRRGRIGAAVVALLLVLIPFVAAAVNHGRWIPQGDDALIEMRARDVGTSRNPLVGQPSTSGSYGERAENVAHPGPIEFELLAPSVRLFGPTTGFLLVTASLVAACLVVSAWAVFRQVGPRGGSLAAVLLALGCFSAGAAGVVEPISSNIGRFPLLAGAVLVWALLCGDLRLAPLAVVVWSFAAQQHLSVLPAGAVVAGVGLVGAAWWVVRGDPDGGLSRRAQLGWLGGAVGAGIVVWSPVLWQQLTGHPGNLSALASYSGDPARQDMGLRSAAGQVAHVLGVPPFLGRSSPRGWDLVAHVGTPQLVLTFVVAGALLAAGAWWARADRRIVAAVAMVGALAVAGLVTGTNIPDSPEKGRLAFYHWAFALSFFELLAVVWLVARLAPIVAPKLVHGRRSTAFGVTVAVLVGVAATPVVADRASDRLNQPIATTAIRALVADVRSSPALRRVRGPLLVLVDGDDRYIQVGDTLAARLLAAGVDARLPTSSKGFAHPDHLLDPCRIDHADHVLVVSLVLDVPTTVPGQTLAAVDAAPSLDADALGRLVAASAGAHVEFGPKLERALGALPGDQGSLIGSTLAFRLARTPLSVLLNRANLDLLIAHPLASPTLRHADLVALRDSFPDGATTVPATGLEAHLLTRAQLARYRPDLLANC
ncbi:MAG: hypothetical protein JWM89_2547 [Acidimicrobiales bacterium]|nr:hypothetical protein [Acidimicrobiales bacterium]